MAKYSRSLNTVLGLPQRNTVLALFSAAATVLLPLCDCVSHLSKLALVDPHCSSQKLKPCTWSLCALPGMYMLAKAAPCFGHRLFENPEL